MDSTASPAMTDVEDTQLSPTETQLADDPISPLPRYKPEAKDEDRGTSSANDTNILLAKPKARIEEDLSATHGTSPARPEDPVALAAASVDKLANLPTLANNTESEGQEYPKWVKVHSSQKVATVGSVPYQPREPWQHHNCSSKQCKRT